MASCVKEAAQTDKSYLVWSMQKQNVLCQYSV